MTFGILQLSWRGVYWKDLDDSNSSQNSALTTIQFVAKLHEICIVASLSAITLLQIQSVIVDGDGVPFGLLTSAYRISSITYLWSWEFWSALLERRLSQVHHKKFRLFTIVILASSLTAVAGQSSAITLLPRLDWWPVSSPTLDSTLNYIGNNSFELWPQILTAKHLPGSDFLTSTGYQNEYYPSAGRSVFEPWYNSPWGPEPNLTIPISDSSMIRFLASSEHAYEHIRTGMTLSSTMHDIAAKTLTCAFGAVTGGFAPFIGQFDSQIGRPIVHQSLLHGESLHKPLVSTQCRSYRIEQRNKNFPFEMHHFFLGSNESSDAWRIPNATWNTSTNLWNPTKFSWIESDSNSNSPSIAAVSVVTLPSPGKRPHPPSISDDTHRRVVACAIDAWWLPVDIWIDPKTDNAIHDNMADVVLDGVGTTLKKLAGAQRIAINKSWADALNIKANGANATMIEALITPRLTPLGPLPHLETTI